MSHSIGTDEALRKQDNAGTRRDPAGAATVTMVDMASWRMTVDGHDWLVRDRPAEPGTYHFDWLTHPHGYGFTIGTSDGPPISEAFMRRAISDFLGQINPETGYLD